MGYGSHGSSGLDWCFAYSFGMPSLRSAVAVAVAVAAMLLLPLSLEAPGLIMKLLLSDTVCG